jgi:hypothetical protein
MEAGISPPARRMSGQRRSWFALVICFIVRGARGSKVWLLADYIAADGGLSGAASFSSFGASLAARC